MSSGPVEVVISYPNPVQEITESDTTNHSGDRRSNAGGADVI